MTGSFDLNYSTFSKGFSNWCLVEFRYLPHLIQFVIELVIKIIEAYDQLSKHITNFPIISPTRTITNFITNIDRHSCYLYYHRFWKRISLETRWKIQPRVFLGIPLTRPLGQYECDTQKRFKTDFYFEWNWNDELESLNTWWNLTK